MRTFDFVEWVGACFYPTIKDFVEEAKAQGIRRRLPFLPKNLVPGLSRCFLAHEQPEIKRICKRCKTKLPKRKVKCPLCGSKDKKTVVTKNPVIFGFYIVGGVELIVKDQEKISKLEEYKEKYNIRPVTISQVQVEERRRCGHRCYPGAMYFYNDGDFEKIYEYVKTIGEDEVEVAGPLIVFKNPYPTKLKFFRGVKNFDPKKHTPPINAKMPESVLVEKRVRVLKTADIREWL